jgi:hypothetical protein
MFSIKFLKRIAIGTLLLFFLLSNIASSKIEDLLFEFMAQQSKMLTAVLAKYKQEVNVENLSAIIVAPTKSFPIRDFQSLEKLNGKEILIGSLFTMNQIEKYKLKPGIYGIILRKIGKDYQAAFIDVNGKEVNKVEAIARKSEIFYKEPIAKFKFNSPGVQISWDEICVEI